MICDLIAAVISESEQYLVSSCEELILENLSGINSQKWAMLLPLLFHICM